MWQQIFRPGDFIKDNVRCELTTRRFIEAAHNFGRRRNDLMLDHDHQSCLVAENGQPAVALGWFTGLTVVDGHQALVVVKHDRAIPDPEPRDMSDGLWGWLDNITPAGQELLKGGQYKYLSGAFDPESTDENGRPIGMDVLSVAATNIPFLSNMKPLDLGFSRSGAGRLVTMSQGLELHAKRSNEMGTKIIVRTNREVARVMADKHAEFGRRVDEKMKVGMTRSQAINEVNADDPTLYTTPSNMRRFDNAGERIPKGRSTTLPATPVDARNPQNVHRPAPTPRPTVDEFAERENRFYECARYYLPTHTPYDLVQLAEIASGRAEAKYRERWARTPDVPVSDFYVSADKRSLIKFITSKMNEDGTYEIGQRLE